MTAHLTALKTKVDRQAGKAVPDDALRVAQAARIAAAVAYVDAYVDARTARIAFEAAFETYEELRPRL